MARPKGSKDGAPRRSQARYAFVDRGMDIVQVAADLMKDGEVEPKAKLEFIGKLLPYLFAKMNMVKPTQKEEAEEDGDEPVLSKDQILAELDKLKGTMN